jgi:hypothetical protein
MDQLAIRAQISKSVFSYSFSKTATLRQNCPAIGRFADAETPIFQAQGDFFDELFDTADFLTYSLRKSYRGGIVMRQRQPSRRGAAAVELAALLPLMVFLFVIALDWGRVYYYSVTLTNAARQGAIYLCDPVMRAASPYTTVSDAALSDCTNLQPSPTVNSTSGTDASGNPYVEVSVSWPMSLITGYPGISNPTNMTGTVRMRQSVVTPP